MAINFFTEGIDFKLKNSIKLKSWIKSVAAEEGYKIGNINYVFCNDDYILQVNRQYLEHDYYTDIITFDDTEKGKLNGDMVVSIDTVQSNALNLNVDVNNELSRVIIHGILHLCGYKDKTPEEETLMREKENYHLQFLNYTII